MAIYLRKKGILTEARRRALIRFSNSVKSVVSKKQNIFEGLNIRYFGPFDGHDVRKLVKILKDIKSMHGPRILHLYTKKGKGYKPAEEDPTIWHAPGRFDPDTGERIIKQEGVRIPLWQEVFGETLAELAEKDERVVGVTAAMPTGTSMNILSDKMPQRAFDVGISEGHAVTFAGGLAAGGKRPFVAIYSSFLQRAYDNIIHDVAIQGLPVTFCIDRAGLVGEDGVTHHGFFDISYLSCVPGLKIAAPADAETLRNLMHSSLELGGPMAIRYPRGKSNIYDPQIPLQTLTPGKGRVVKETENARIAIITVGPILQNALAAADLLAKDNIAADIYDFIWIKPLDIDLLNKIAKKYDAIITVEDGVLSGGFGASVADYIGQLDKKPEVKSLGIPDSWIMHGDIPHLQKQCGFDPEGIKDTAKKLLEKYSK